jgi:hypothetical protein
MEEIFKDIKGFEGRYQVSNLGRIRRLEHYVKVGNHKRKLEKMIMKPTNGAGGYSYIAINKKTKLVHRLVAETFLEQPLNKNVVNHKDFNKSNNQVSNLEWVTQKENLSYSKTHLLDSFHPTTGEHNITIRKRKKKPYFMQITRKGKEYKKAFSSLEEAIKARDEIIAAVGEGWNV